MIDIAITDEDKLKYNDVINLESDKYTFQTKEVAVENRAGWTVLEGIATNKETKKKYKAEVSVVNLDRKNKIKTLSDLNRILRYYTWELNLYEEVRNG